MQSYARVTMLGLMLGSASSGCSSAGQIDSMSDEAAGERSLALYPSFLQSVRVYRLPSVSVISALDSQNALPSGVLADPTVLSRLRDLGASQLLPSSPALAALRALPGGRGAALLKYLARCALPEASGVLPGYPGRLGLAPHWPGRPLNVSEQRWITACLMAHTNNLASVSIAASGTLPVFSTAGSHAGLPLRYPYEEAAFYGTVFENVPRLFACSGAGTQSSCTDRGAGEDLQRRICGTASAASCGFQYMHECNKLPLGGGAWAPGACSAAMPYANCAGTAGVRFTEVVTTSLRTDAELLGLHPSCTQRPAPSCSSPAHDVCTMGEALGEKCSSGVCSSDPYCCSVMWDSNCVAKAREKAGCP